MIGYFVLILALIWGGIWAAFLQFTIIGRFLAIKRTWITVVIGVGIDLLIALLVIPWEYWLWMVVIIAVSSIGIIFRSLWNERHEWGEILNAIKDPAGK